MLSRGQRRAKEHDVSTQNVVENVASLLDAQASAQRVCVFVSAGPRQESRVAQGFKMIMSHAMIKAYECVEWL